MIAKGSRGLAPLRAFHKALSSGSRLLKTSLHLLERVRGKDTLQMNIRGHIIFFEGHKAVSVAKLIVILNHKRLSAKYRSRIIVHYPNA